MIKFIKMKNVIIKFTKQKLVIFKSFEQKNGGNENLKMNRMMFEDKWLRLKFLRVDIKSYFYCY